MKPYQNYFKNTFNNNYIKMSGDSTFNKIPNYFKKINSIYENNYTHKHLNTNSKSDLARTGKIPTDKNYRNTQNGNLHNKRQIQKSFISNYNNNSLNFINNRTSLNKSHKKEMTSERSQNKDYRFKKLISNVDNSNNHISLNDLIINKQNNVNNKSIDLQIYDFIKKNKEEKDNLNKKEKYQQLSKMSINKSMDSKRVLNKNNNINNNIIHMNNNGKIINLSNLNNFSYATDKYDCYYENKREIPNLNLNNDKKKNSNKNKTIKNNINNNYYTNNNINNTTNKKTEKKEENLNKTKPKNLNINIKNNPILFTKQYPKKENIKYPLRINYTSENLSNALETESLLDYTEEKENDNKNNNNDKDIPSKRSKNISKNNIYNSFHNDDNMKLKKKKIYQIHKNNGKKEENIVEPIKNNPNYYHTERISSNNTNIRNNSLGKVNKIVIQKNHNLFFNGEDKDIEKNSFKIDGNKNEAKIKNNIPKINFTTNHDSISFNSIKKEKKNYNLKIKNNDRLMFINNQNNNKINTEEDNSIINKKAKTYKISSHVVNEQFYRDNFSEKEINSSDDENILRMSMQSLNDSKIMEIANRYITDEENLDKNEIIEILNSKKDKN
jgi:hypothetical protein